MQAIKTCYIPAGQHHGAKVRAVCTTGYIKVPHDSGLDDFGNHAAACKALLNKIGWTPDRGYPDQWHGGEFAGDYFWVLAINTTRLA